MKKIYTLSERISVLVPVPVSLLIASRSADGYFSVIREYTLRHDCSFQDAWAYLEQDLQEYGLPNRYSTIESFKRGKGYHYRRKS